MAADERRGQIVNSARSRRIARGHLLAAYVSRGLLDERCREDGSELRVELILPCERPCGVETGLRAQQPLSRARDGRDQQLVRAADGSEFLLGFGGTLPQASILFICF